MGSGGRDFEISNVETKEKCVELCSNRKESDLTINGITYSRRSTGNCWCEQGMERIKHEYHNFYSCYLIKD